jgi:aminoglycoside phosphotransferase (APT) family kinase protein
MTDDQQLSMAATLGKRATRAAQGWRPGATVTDVSPLTGGASSLTFVATVTGGPGADQRLVLKVAPPGLEPVRNRDVLRQGRVLRGLHDAPGVVVPAVYFADEGEPVLVPPFIAMALVPGECVEPVLADEHDPARRPEYRARGLDAARVLAAIHRVQPEQAGLGDEPVVSLSSEVDRWTRAFGTVPDDLRGDYQRCERALREAMPTPLPAAINHGDYRLGNTLCDGGRLTAVIDWEIWSLGDPRVDVSWMLYFTDEARHPAAPSAEPTGVPSGPELLTAYADAGGASLADLDWFHALTRYKEAAATALLIKRGRKTGNLPPTMLRMAPRLPELLDEAEHFLARQGASNDV